MADFAAQIRAFRNKAVSRLNAIVQESTVNITTAIIERTPIDTTALRANWQFTVGTPGSEVDYSLRDLSPGGSATAAALAEQIRAVPAGNVTYVVNNLPYIRTIEYGLYPSHSRTGKTVGGFSTQAPGPNPPGAVRGLTAIEWSTNFVPAAVAKVIST